MLSTPSRAPARSATRTGARGAAVRRALPADALAARGAALEALGDAIALIDAERNEVAWTGAAWRAALPEAVAGSDLAALHGRLPNLSQAMAGWPPAVPGAADGEASAPQPGATPVARWDEIGAWRAELGATDVLGRRLFVLRLADRRGEGRALQRQLDDREQLLFTSRVISVGEMASTLAHELNQPIGATANLLRGLRARLQRSGAERLEEAEVTALDRAIDQVMFAARVIARIREFTHARQPRPVRLDLAALVKKSAALLDWDLERSGTRLALQGVAAPVWVRGDEVMLQQVLVNLMRNALDAMRGEPPAAPCLEVAVAEGEQGVEVAVRDNGCGLSSEAEARLFVPFASSKPSGMGLGLSICRSFIELHQGRLWFSRNAERGATFHISLPREAANASR